MISRLRNLDHDNGLDFKVPFILSTAKTKTIEQQQSALGTHNLRLALSTTFDDGSQYIRSASDSFTVIISCNRAALTYPFTSLGA